MIPPVGGGNGYSFTSASCTVDLNPGCPDDMKIFNVGNVVACKCSCVAYNRDDYCCRGAFNDEKCLQELPFWCILQEQMS